MVKKEWPQLYARGDVMATEAEKIDSTYVNSKGKFNMDDTEVEFKPLSEAEYEEALTEITKEEARRAAIK